MEKYKEVLQVPAIVRLSVFVRSVMENWKRLVYIIAALQVGLGITIIGVVSFIPLFLTSELGVTDPGEAAFWSGLISGVTPFFVAFSTPVWTLQAQKHGEKAALAGILLLLSIFIFLNIFVQNPWQFLILRVLQGMTGGFVAIGMALVMNITPKEKLPWSMGIFQASMVLGLMFGPLAGGLIADLFGYRAPFMAFTAITVLCLYVTLTHIPRHAGPETQKERLPFRRQLSLFIHNPVIRLMIMLQFLCNFGMSGIGPILPLYIQRMMGADAAIVATIVGIIIFAAGGMSVCSSLMVPRLTEHFPMSKIIAVATLLSGVNFILQYMMPTVVTLGIMRGLTGLTLGMVMPIANTIIASAVTSEQRGMVVGFAASFSIMGNVAGPVASGAIAMDFGYPSVFWVTAACFFVASALIYKRRRLIRAELAVGKKR